MARKKGPLQQITDAVEGAVQAVAVEVGLSPEHAESAPRSRAARKAAHKEVIARAEHQQNEAKEARRSLRRRAS